MNPDVVRLNLKMAELERQKVLLHEAVAKLILEKLSLQRGCGHAFGDPTWLQPMTPDDPWHGSLWHECTRCGWGTIGDDCYRDLTKEPWPPRVREDVRAPKCPVPGCNEQRISCQKHY